MAGQPQLHDHAYLADLAALLTESCRAVDPSSTDEVLTALRSHAQGMDPAF